MSPRRGSKHAQRGVVLGTCPDCDQKIWSTQPTINLPVRIDGRWYGCLVHKECADRDL